MLYKSEFSQLNCIAVQMLDDVIKDACQYRVLGSKDCYQITLAKIQNL